MTDSAKASCDLGHVATFDLRAATRLCLRTGSLGICGWGRCSSVVVREVEAGVVVTALVAVGFQSTSRHL
jgi:hypothetical protein